MAELSKKEAVTKTGFDKKEVESGKVMAILSYIIALIPYFAEKKNKFVRYHAVQGMNILIIAVGWAIVGAIINSVVQAIFCSTGYGYWYSSCWYTFGIEDVISWIISFVGLGIGILDIMGLVYAATGKAKEVPILGKIKIIKK